MRKDSRLPKAAVVIGAALRGEGDVRQGQDGSRAGRFKWRRWMEATTDVWQPKSNHLHD
jgi:hypothetical protein